MRLFLTRSRLGASGWVAGAALLAFSGAVGSVFGARALAWSDHEQSQRAVASASADVAAQLRLAIQRELDLALNTSAFVAANPNISNVAFNRWVKADRVFERYPEMLGLVRIVLVEAPQLPAYAAKAEKSPVGSLAPDGSFHVIPPGNRSHYCFIDLTAIAPKPAAPGPAAGDLCAGAPGRKLLAARDSGQSTYEPVPLGAITGLGIQTPLYRDGVVPATVAARRAAFIGWIGYPLMPSVVLSAALDGHPDTAVTLRFARGSSAVTFASGKAPHGAQSLTTDFQNGWTVRTAALVSGAGVFSNGNSLALLISGMALSVLVSLLGVVLATGRTRALRLVSEQTVVLRDQAAELRVTVAELEAAEAVKDEFLASVSHEFRTPLTSIRGYAELLGDEDLADDQLGYVNVIERNSARLVSLVEGLLVMAQIQSGGLPLELSDVILNELIARAGEDAEPFAASKNIDLDIDTEPGIAMQGDAVRLGQVLDNLVSNAIKYTPKGGAVSISMIRVGETATISVSDTGIGIPPHEQTQMFGRFFRTSNARDSGIEGSGLGLAITRGIVEAHGGTIEFESVEGRGTTFRLTLPHAHDSGLASAA